MKKALFYDPYLDTVGGGERYILTLADHLLTKGWEVDIVWKDQNILKKIHDRFGFNLEKLGFIDYPKNLFQKYYVIRNYDFVFWLSDGSIPFLFSKNNILHFQVPFHDISGRSLINKIKLSSIDQIVCNSGFTKNFIDMEFGVDSRVIYPPIDTSAFTVGVKKNQIIYVGRFSQLLQVKRQDVLINVFKKVVDAGLNNWKLILAGSIDIGGDEYFNQLADASKNYPIELIKNPDFETIKKLYSESKIFWSASGYGIDEAREPQKVEHFGMTIVEAMVSGCVPIVIKKGGAKEIIVDGDNGYFWETENQLQEITQKLISNEKELDMMKTKMIKSGKQYSIESFTKKFDEIIK